MRPARSDARRSVEVGAEHEQSEGLGPHPRSQLLVWSFATLPVDRGRGQVEGALNASTARLQPIEISAGRRVDAEHLFDVELKGREPLLEALPQACSSRPRSLAIYCCSSTHCR